jgi:transglutaminase-like putative cysteine protease
MRLVVNYATSYHYSEPVRRVIQLLRVTPLTFDGQNVVDWRIDADVDVKLREGRDGYGNILHMLYVDRPITALKVSVTGRVMTEDRSGLVGGSPHELPPVVFTRSTALTEPDAGLKALAAEMNGGGGATLDRLHRLNAAIHERLRFDTDSTESDTKACEALAAGHGVCQDFAQIFIATARLMGLPARYVSGHLFRRDGNERQEAAHAWAEAYVDPLGWVAFDPTNGISPDDAYIRVAIGLDYKDAAPFAGARAGGGEEELDVEVQVRQARMQAQAQSQS